MFDVVIVDDQTTSLKIVQQLVIKTEPQARVQGFRDPTLALEYVKANGCDLLITDLRMPTMTGSELIRWFRSLPQGVDVPIVVVTVAEDRASRHAALGAGATDFLIKPLDHIEFQTRCRNLLRLREQHLLIKDRARWLERRVSHTVAEIERREQDTLLRLARVGESRDPCTGRHVQRIGQYCRLIACELGQDELFCKTLEHAAPLHDIGKVGIPDHILLKEDALTTDEWAVMRTHPQIGHDILANSPSVYLQMGARIALNHHEHYDGSGYPQGLSGAAIPLEARIVAVADMFDALLSQRPYKEPWPLERALTRLRDESGRRLDPACVDALLQTIDAALEIRARLADAPPPARPPIGRHG